MEITKAVMDPVKPANPKVLFVEGSGYSMNLFLRVGGGHSICLLQGQGPCRASLCCGSQFFPSEKPQHFSCLIQIFLR